MTKAPRALVLARALALLALLGLSAGAVAILSKGPHRRPASIPAAASALDEGTRLSGKAPRFTLTDQLGRSVSLASLRGRAVLLAFVDSRCTTICPLTTAEMLDAQRMLGPAGSQLALLGVDANPLARSIADVRAYSRLHGLLGHWSFLTGSLPRLRRVWQHYHIETQILHGEIDHTPALYLIDRSGDLKRLYLTGPSYSEVAPQARLVAHAVSDLLPGRPAVHTQIAYVPVGPGAPPSAAATSRQLAGSSAPLRALHEQAGTLIGPASALSARLRALRGYPIVLNVWASWCAPCRAEFPLLASVSARYGRRVAFLGADAEDQAGDARSFLAAHPVSYPSYPASTAALDPLAAIPGLPTTIFIDRSGKVVHVHIGPYGTLATLEEDLGAYARSG
jgi:cytochrome oxidase Cu insertion factor (SCO1/SenC/PrrC family)/thiol-disulfide isomerase/thioredoxin